MTTEFSDIVRIMAVHSSRVEDAYEVIGGLERSEDGYSAEIPYDNGIFRLWLGESGLGSITYRKWGEGIVTLTAFIVHDFHEDEKGEQTYASAIELASGNVDQAQHDFLESFAEQIKNRLEFLGWFL
jgi:hypothetical protein